MKILAGLSSTSEKTSLLRFRRLTVLVQLLVDLPPAWESAEVAVVNEEACMNFSAYIGRMRGFFRVGTVYGIGWNALVFHELYGVLKFGAVAVSP